MSDSLVYHYYPASTEPLLAEGATIGHLVIWDGMPGPACIAKVVVLADGEGVISVEQAGDFEPCTVVDDA